MTARRRLMRRRIHKVGFSPGSLVYVGSPRTERVKIHLTAYNKEHFWESDLEHPEECGVSLHEGIIKWIHVSGLHEVEVIEKIGRCFDLHPLLLEDVLNTGQRPKVEDYDNCLFIVLKVFSADEKELKVSFEQLSIVLGPSFVISFQEGGQDIFQPIRKRLVNSKGRIRKMDAGYLAYALMDTAVDHYFVALDVVGEETESLEKELQEAPTQETLERIHGIKRKILFMRKSIWPLREFTGRLERLENHYIGSETHLFLRDLYDHVIQATENLEVLWETVSGLLQIYLSVVSNRMNEVMKVLTLIATLFIPLTFIAGVYGMNFKYMPELEWRWGYPLIWLVMILVAFSLILFFKKKKWL